MVLVISMHRYLPILILALLIAPAASAQTPALLVFGGDDHKTFLGCLNCNKYSAGSVCNEYGANGSKYNTTSIWNPYGTFGSKYSHGSPWNQYSTAAPIVVDNSGQSYGYLSANKYHSNRTRIDGLNQLADLIADTDDLDKARDIFCGE